MNFPWKRILTRWKKGYARFWDFFFKGPSWSPPPDGLVSNRFHYRSSSLMLFVWCKGILKRIFTLPGEFLFLVMLFSGFYSSTIFNTPAVLLFFVLLSIFLIDFTAGLVFFPKLSGTRSMPDRVRSGDPFTVCCCIRNRRRRMPVFDLIADPFLRFPGNAKEETPVPVKEIPGGGEITLEREVTVSRRGVHKIGAFLAETSYPFHLLKISRNLDPRPSILICHPRPLALDPEEIRTGTGDALLPAGGNSLFPRTGESMNFHGCRKFRYGDARKKICWRASARHRTLVVKEFQEETQNRFSLVLDTFQPSFFSPVPGNGGGSFSWTSLFHLIRKSGTPRIFPPGGKDLPSDAVFETAVSLAVSIAENLVLRKGFLIDAFAAGSRLEKAGENRNSDNLTSFLDLLASVQPERKDPFLLLDNDALDAIAACGSVFLILLRNDEKAWELHERLLMRGAEVSAFLISDAKDSALRSPHSCFQVISPRRFLFSSDSPLSGSERSQDS